MSDRKLRAREMNVGILATGGYVNAPGVVAGTISGPVTVAAPPHPEPGPEPGPVPEPTDRPAGARVDVGILTVLPVEQRAIVEALQHLRDYRTDRPIPDGPLVHRAEAGTVDRPVHVAAFQMVDRGNTSAAVALELVRELSPGVVVLTGIAGGIGTQVGLGDVVLSDAVVLYDPRKITSEGVHHRGDSYVISAAVRYRLNEFMVDTGGRVRDPQGGSVRVLQGAIGGGSAVLADGASEDREWLLRYNDKLLAVETESAGLAQAFHQVAGAASRPVGWLAVRGISDLADGSKDDSRHEEASRNAAAVVVALLPHLSFDRPDRDRS